MTEDDKLAQAIYFVADNNELSSREMIDKIVDLLEAAGEVR